MVISENDAWSGRVSSNPFVLLAQHSIFDVSRVPTGKHTAWAYCHVPNGSNIDMTEAIEKQVERFAPGFRDCIIGKSVLPPQRLHDLNDNLVGGDITGGANTLSQLLTRPLASFNPYRFGGKGLYLCSASTPPGGGVHGMCGSFAADSVLSDARNNLI